MEFNMLQMSAGEFKTHCLKLMDLAQQKRETIVITKRGIPVAKLVPFEKTKIPLYGFMKGTVTIKGDIVAPVFDEWEADKDENDV
jgi:prevent-host-death family protein